MKRVAFILNNLKIGGPQKGILALTENFDYNKIDVTIVLLQSTGNLKEYIDPHVHIIMADELTKATTLPTDSKKETLYTFIRHGKFDMLFDAVFNAIGHYIFNKNMNQQRQSFWKKYNSRLPKLDGQYDACFAAMFGLTTYYAVNCVNSTKKYYWIINDYRDVKLEKTIEEYYLKQMDGALSDSKMCADIFVEYFPFMRDKISLFYNMIPFKFYSRIAYDHGLIGNKGSVRLISVCRLDPLKGIDMAIKACSILHRKGYDIDWYILGDGPERRMIENLISQYQLSDRFHLLGFQLNPVAYMKLCDIFVHPTLAEGKSIAVDEAIATGIPCVVTDYPVSREQIHDGVNGVICDMTSEGIADAVAKMIDSDSYNTRKKSDDCISDPTDFFLSLT